MPCDERYSATLVQFSQRAPRAPEREGEPRRCRCRSRSNASPGVSLQWPQRGACPGGSRRVAADPGPTRDARDSRKGVSAEHPSPDRALAPSDAHSQRQWLTVGRRPRKAQGLAGYAPLFNFRVFIVWRVKWKWRDSKDAMFVNSNSDLFTTDWLRDAFSMRQKRVFEKCYRKRKEIRSLKQSEIGSVFLVWF